MPKTRLHFNQLSSVEGISRLSTDAIVLVHGWACSAQDWSEFEEPLARLAPVITLDLRGHGRSEIASDGRYSPHAMADDLICLLDHLLLRRVILIAHSAGAEVAASVAVRHAERVDALIAVDPAFGLTQSDLGRLAASSERFAVEDPLAVVVEYFANFPEETAALTARHRESALGARPDVVRAMFDEFAFGPESLRFRPETDHFLARRAAPILGIYAREERARQAAELLARPGDRVLTYAGSGHWPHQQHADRFLADVVEWLADIGLVKTEHE
ncbi:MAG: alpha/beta hydrolase [Actinomycetota bacterium]|nr:alpha/beta hydrolase [Actinomycetota bacterium]